MKGRETCFLFCIKQRDAILKILNDNGFTSEPIWLDEFGWISNSTPGDQQTQANKTMDTLARLATIPRMKAAILYHLSDDPRVDSDYGLLFSDGSPKEVFYRLRDSSPL